MKEIILRIFLRIISFMLITVSFFIYLKNILWLVYMDILSIEGYIPHSIPISYNVTVAHLLFAIGITFLIISFEIKSLRGLNEVLFM